MPEAVESPRWPLAAVALLLVANVVVPLALGDVYPFTSAPMFRDCPGRCANYRVFAADGSELEAEEWLLGRVYDGNPVGYGVGVRPPAVIELEFGAVANEAQVRAHVQQQLARAEHRRHPFVDVVQEIVGPLSGTERIGVVQSNRWRIERPR
jgi:hypothetical protein